MLASTDWTGLSAFVAAVAAACVSVIGALAALRTNRQIQTGNGRTLGQAVVEAKRVAVDTNAKVTTIRDGQPPIHVDPHDLPG